MIYDYNQSVVFLNSLKVDDIGNTCIRTIADDKGAEVELYLIIATSQGMTLMVEFGPVIPDLPILHKDYKLTVNSIPFKEPKINKAIISLLNSIKYPATKAEVIELDEALSALPKIEEVIEYHMSEVH